MYCSVPTQLLPLVIKWAVQQVLAPRPFFERGHEAPFLEYGKPSAMGDMDIESWVTIKHSAEQQVCDCKALVHCESENDIHVPLVKERARRLE